MLWEQVFESLEEVDVQQTGGGLFTSVEMRMPLKALPVKAWAYDGLRAIRDMHKKYVAKIGRKESLESYDKCFQEPMYANQSTSSRSRISSLALGRC
jgi:hypothetical protein